MICTDGNKAEGNREMRESLRMIVCELVSRLEIRGENGCELGSRLEIRDENGTYL